VDEGVQRVSGGLRAAVSLFLVEHRGVFSVIDTGTEGSARRILRAIREAGRKPEDVRQIVLTHCHGDHTGEARRLKLATGATVVAGLGDQGVIEGREPYPEPVDRLFRAVFSGLTRFSRLEVDRAVNGREELEGGIVAVPTPGHTAGHIAVLALDLDAAFVGDLVWNLGSLRPSWRRVTQDRDRCAESIREVAAERVTRVIPGHGRAVSIDRLRALAKRR
jgi:glyoxylase-like metal-dependent hydrolase (beta-lactamase superfamily II)